MNYLRGQLRGYTVPTLDDIDRELANLRFFLAWVAVPRRVHRLVHDIDILLEERHALCGRERRGF